MNEEIEIKDITEENNFEEKYTKLEKEYLSLKNEYLKVYAEMENTKRRLKDEAIKDRMFANQKIVGELIEPLDMFLQILNMPVPSTEVQNYQTGFQMIVNQLVNVLNNDGLSQIIVGKDFDPKYMEAIEIETIEGYEDNQVIRVLKHGYIYKGRVLKPALVVVNKIIENGDVI